MENTYPITLKQVRELFEQYKISLLMVKYNHDADAMAFVEKFEAILTPVPTKFQALAKKIFMENYNENSLSYSKSNFYCIINKITTKFKKYAKLLLHK